MAGKELKITVGVVVQDRPVIPRDGKVPQPEAWRKNYTVLFTRYTYAVNKMAVKTLAHFKLWSCRVCCVVPMSGQQLTLSGTTKVKGVSIRAISIIWSA